MIGGSSVYATGAQMQLGWGIDLTTRKCLASFRRARISFFLDLIVHASISLGRRSCLPVPSTPTVGGVLVTIGWQYGAANAALLRVGGGQFGVGAWEFAYIL